LREHREPGRQAIDNFQFEGRRLEFMWEKVRTFDLCPKLSGLQLAKGLCFSHQSGTCKGACAGVESVARYNAKVQKAVNSFLRRAIQSRSSGLGRKADENSLVLVEKGNYLGFGFFEKK